MAADLSASEFVPLDSGLTNSFANRIGLVLPWRRRLLRMLLLTLVTWVPILVLAAINGHVSGSAVAVTLLSDAEVNCRFLLTLPLLEISEVLLALSLSTQVSQLARSGIIPQACQDQFEAIRRSVRRFHNAASAEIALGVIAFVTSVTVRLYATGRYGSTWERQGHVITPAGWWHLLVSLPILYFFVLRALWLLVLWGWFLFRVSRLELDLTPTHPDHAGGLGFLGWGLVSFAPVAFAFSTVVSAGFAFEIHHRGESLQSLKYHIIVYTILVTLILHLPLIPFSIQLSKCRFLGLLEFSQLVWRHDRAFDEKWIHKPTANESLLGTSDVQSLADIATAYEHVNDMRILPIDVKASTTLVVASALPMLPLIGTEVPIAEILTKLGEVLL